MTQSDNSSARMALSMDEFYLHYYMNLGIKPDFEWNRLETILESSFDTFSFIGNVFNFRMLNKIIDDLIPTGVMNHLIEKYYFKKFRQAHDDDTKPQVLNLNDLSFGFNIWLGFCLISIVAFIAEHIYKLLQPKKRKFAKVNPDFKDSIDPVVKLSSQLIEKFRIKKHPQNDESVLSIESLANTEEVCLAETSCGLLLSTSFISTDIEVTDIEFT